MPGAQNQLELMMLNASVAKILSNLENAEPQAPITSTLVWPAIQYQLMVV